MVKVMVTLMTLMAAVAGSISDLTKLPDACRKLP